MQKNSLLANRIFNSNRIKKPLILNIIPFYYVLNPDWTEGVEFAIRAARTRFRLQDKARFIFVLVLMLFLQ